MDHRTRHKKKKKNETKKMYSLLTNIHQSAEIQENQDKLHLISGNYEYYHYLCDGFDDRGWGCGYRTLQTICSWIKLNYENVSSVPTIKEIQEILIQLEDKPSSFLGSRQWIGSFEVCLVIDKLYDVPCKILHVNKGDELAAIVETLVTHFDKFGSPIMMGGDVDCSSKGIMGIDVRRSEPSLLIVDPHYVGKEHSTEFLQNKGWVKWQPLGEFLCSSFYNLCLPQAKAKYGTANETSASAFRENSLHRRPSSKISLDVKSYPIIYKKKDFVLCTDTKSFEE